MSERKFVLPKYNYKKYARYSSIPKKLLLEIITAYITEQNIINDNIICNSNIEYQKLKEPVYNELKELIDVNIYDNVIKSSDKIEKNKMIMQDETKDFYDIILSDYSGIDLSHDISTNKISVKRVIISTFVEWAVRKMVPIPKEFIDFNLSGDLASIVNNFYTTTNTGSNNQVIKSNGKSNQSEGTNYENKNSLMIEYALKIGAYCNENNRDDYTPTFDDVVEYIAGVYGKDCVPDYWVKEILSYDSDNIAKKDGRPKKVLDDAFRVGFCMREWYDENNNITERDFQDRYKRDLPKAGQILRAKAWKLLLSYHVNETM